MRKNNFNMWLVVALLFTVGVLGWGVYRASNESFGNNGLELGVGGGPNDGQLISPLPQEQSATSSSDQDTIRASLVTILPEHGEVAINHLQAIYDEGNTAETLQAVEANNRKLFEVIERLGGPQARDQFLAMWMGHIAEYENYTYALKANDRNATMGAREALSQHAEGMGEQLHSLAPNLSADEGKRLMEEHVDLTLGVIESHARRDMAEKSERMAAAAVQSITMANAIADNLQAAE